MENEFGLPQNKYIFYNLTVGLTVANSTDLLQDKRYSFTQLVSQQNQNIYLYQRVACTKQKSDIFEKKTRLAISSLFHERITIPAYFNCDCRAKGELRGKSLCYSTNILSHNTNGQARYFVTSSWHCLKWIYSTLTSHPIKRV